jgi:hypothetical protein
MPRARSRWRKSHGDLTLRSNLEKKVATFLDSRKVEYKYEESTLPYTIPESNHKYCPDFELPNGIIIEVKGRLTAADRKKMLLVKKQNPDKDIRFLFAVDNKISKASKTTYSIWCQKNGFDYHVCKEGKIPASWLQPIRKKNRPVEPVKSKT